MKDLKALALARDLGIPASDFDRIVAPLEALEETFRPLAASLMPEHEPCTIFRAEEDVE